jgi:hypothetical protein
MLDEVIAYLRSPQAIRERSAQLYHLCQVGDSDCFQLDLDRLDAVVDYVDQVIQDHYPEGVIPAHTRWRHFPQKRLATIFNHLSPLERLKAEFDLVVPSVLLDAGAGDRWHYVDSLAQVWHRSEGLAVASLELFTGGLLAQGDGLKTEAIALQELSLDHLAQAFQVTPTNSLVGLTGRLGLLHKLGQCLQASSLLPGTNPRPGDLADYLLDQTVNQQLSALVVLQVVLETLSPLWSDHLTLQGIPLGDIWIHSKLASLLPQSTTGTTCTRLIPFHKLCQWLTYSLLEPLQQFGLTIVDQHHLTGLAEYRNGGLFLDLGVLQLKQPHLAQVKHSPDSELIVEWRGLTIHLLDLMAEGLRHRRHLSPAALPLTQILQGGTWLAGREIAAQRRPLAAPPLQLVSDGTIF